MKKLLIICVTSIILVSISFIVTNKYNKNSSAAATSNQSDQQISNDNSAIKASKFENEIDFTLKDLNGNDVKLSDYKGKNVYLNFFATWCPPCREEMPDIEKVYQKYKNKDFVVLAINLGEDRDTVKNFITQNKYNFNVLLDSDQSVATQYNITAIPVSIFINKDGQIVSKKVGAMSGVDMELNIKLLLHE
ncbi:TlpA disulfide reductase family protein [Anaeromicropila herbilytica]|uniref:Thioredoxin domain-containing protein n=1 Tax=Anaeromicropila herbilytica TaxID=2785025 RepID=A0A7R7EIU8_9FIRM|nr:redoxin family protein [Anaeromicropila herbilytica]BCN29563.1 hypothetical protein bsdtb5_08580 [Anaeromicropila herbilytica]